MHIYGHRWWSTHSTKNTWKYAFWSLVPELRRLTLKENVQKCPPRASSQHVAPPNSDCLACRKVAGVVRIISNPLYLLLQVLHFSGFCSIKLDFGHPRDKNLRDINQGKEQTHLVLSFVPETCCSRIPELQEENVSEHPHAWIINVS
jgi:hypothetical protein